MQPRCFTLFCVINEKAFFLPVYQNGKWKSKVQSSHVHSVCVYWYLWVYVFVIEGGCGAFIAPSRSGTIALFWPVSPEGGSSIRRSRHSVCQQGSVWDWVSTATWSSEHRNAIVPPSRLWLDQTHMQTHTHINRLLHVHARNTQHAGGAQTRLRVPPKTRVNLLCYIVIAYINRRLNIASVLAQPLRPDISSRAVCLSEWKPQ